MMNEKQKYNDCLPLMSVVILNWNGFNDTVECLRSLACCSYRNFEVILVDNASEDNSPERITEWIANEKNTPPKQSYTLCNNDNRDIIPGNIPLYFIINPENFGFAKGNNIGIAEALKHHADFIMLLNNDTTVDKSFTEELISFFTRNPDYGVATPQIRYYSRPDIIWNCGGRLNAMGSRRYFYADQPSARVKKKDFLDVTFITGCALCVRADVFHKFGLLTEDFFFGEEDYEFSLRIRKVKIKAACVLPSVIYHKVNTSVAKTGSVLIGKVYIHYLNRFINLKKYYSPFRWQLMRYFSVFYIFGLLFLRYRVSSAKSIKLIRLLLANSLKMNRVGKSEFEKFIRGDFS